MYMGMRFTHSQFSDLSANKAISIVKNFWTQTKYNCQQYTWGVEKLDSLGKSTHEHLHFHAVIDPDREYLKNSIQADFRKVMKSYGYKIEGNKHYALCYNVSPEDEARWLRYPFKEEKGKHGCSPDLKEFMMEQRAIAQDERKRQIEDNLKAQERFLDKSSFKGKMYEKLDEDGVEDERLFAIEYIKYCREKQKIPSFSKIHDYWIDYQMSTGRMTAEYWVLNYYQFK